MKELLKLLLGFLPWIAFALLAGPSLLSLERAVVACFLIALVLGFNQLKKGFVLTWGSVAFFGANVILVVLLKNVWTMRHMGILAPLTLTAIAWISIFLGKPFVLQIARESAPAERREDKEFIAGCRNLTFFWGYLFIGSTLIAFAKSVKLGGPEWMYGVLSAGITVFGIAYTEWFKFQKKRQRERIAEQPSRQ
jgi:carotenoid cleavage dioxygenase